jgi:hypothetical protein
MPWPVEHLQKAYGTAYKVAIINRIGSTAELCHGI